LVDLFEYMMMHGLTLNPMPSSSYFIYSTSILAEMALRNISPVLSQNPTHMHAPKSVCTRTHAEILQIHLTHNYKQKKSC